MGRSSSPLTGLILGMRLSAQVIGTIIQRSTDPQRQIHSIYVHCTALMPLKSSSDKRLKMRRPLLKCSRRYSILCLSCGSKKLDRQQKGNIDLDTPVPTIAHPPYLRFENVNDFQFLGSTPDARGPCMIASNRPHTSAAHDAHALTCNRSTTIRASKFRLPSPPLHHNHPPHNRSTPTQHPNATCNGPIHPS
jgi:hypothetical protein